MLPGRMGVGARRPVIVDGLNLAHGIHRNRNILTLRGVIIAVAQFVDRGYEVHVYLPRKFKSRYRFKMCPESAAIFDELVDMGILKDTCGRRLYNDEGQAVYEHCDDDYFVVSAAHAIGGVILSNDQFRDVKRNHPHLKDTIEERLIPYIFVDESTLLIPEDPRGPDGPTMDDILHFSDQDNRDLRNGDDLLRDMRRTLLGECEDSMSLSNSEPTPGPLISRMSTSSLFEPDEQIKEGTDHVKKANELCAVDGMQKSVASMSCKHSLDVDTTGMNLIDF